MRARKASIGKDPRNPDRPWVARWTESTEDGRRVRRSKAFALQRDAEKFANRKTRELRGEIPTRAEPRPEQVGGLGDTPLVVFIAEYIRRRKADGLRVGTLNRCRHSFDRLEQHFGAGRSLASLTTDAMSRFVAAQRTIRKGREGRVLQKSSRNSIVTDLRTLFAYAREWGYVTKSPMDGIRMLKVNEDDRRGWHYFSPEDIQALLDATPTLLDRAAFVTLYGVGLRFGELFSLNPADIDLKAGYVHVNPREATASTPPFQVKDHERRSVPIPEYVAELVRELKATLPKKHPYLFVSPKRCERVQELWRGMASRGESWENRLMVNNTLRRLRLYATRAGIVFNGPVTVHSLRKSYGRNGARCLTADVLKAYMGHAEIATTLTYYSKRTEDDDVRARWLLDAMMKGEPVQDLSLSDVQSDVRADSAENRKIG